MTYFAAGEWPVSYAGAGCSAFAQGQPGADYQDEFEQLAVNLLWTWTNRVYGTRQETIRPKRVKTPWTPTTWEGMGPSAAYYDLGQIRGFGWLPAWSAGTWSEGGSWLSLFCGLCGASACEHSDSRAIRLPGQVQSVDKVTIDGVTLPRTAYRLDYGSLLIRQDGSDWPTDQDLLSPLTETNTWSVSFTHGVPVPPGGQVAAGILACELYKASINDDTCGLPSRVKSVTRQGVSLEIVQTEFSRITKGGSNQRDAWTMIFPIDSWISSIVEDSRAYVGVASPDVGARSFPRPRSGWSGTYGRG